MQFIPYFLGCAIGFVILENRPIKFTKVRMMIIIVVIKINFFFHKQWQEILIWSFSTLFLVTIPFASYIFASNEMKISGDGTTLNAINFAIMVLLWSLSNTWLVYQCAIKPRMIISSILSANFFKPISRLSFSLYLSHLMTIWFMAHQVRDPVSMANWTDILKVISATLLSAIIIGYFLHLTFEAPTIGLLLLFFKDKKLLKTLRSFDHRTNQKITII